ncbi:TIGR01777 family oxidoreductase [Paenibacillus taiwanensis]|uniref:TIGR01777 family oxidoreductase n=1 Tax=Paenibacillus taiwanensis TaxID=401638 RepID=UPI000405CB12|nr:TIGR01777 family oxidoreductase [Paenibacillus taiwanensis]
MAANIVLAGGSGFLGQALGTYLSELGYTCCILTRGEAGTRGGIRYVKWDGRTQSGWEHELEGAHGVVNFTGKSVNCLYTKANRNEIMRSRLDAVRVIDEAVCGLQVKPKVIVQAGSLAIFGNTERECDEDAAHGNGFSVEVCQQWEKAFFQQDIPDVRKVMLRIGFALGSGGGALAPLMRLARFGLGGTIGSGRQYISWLHLHDLNAMFRYVLEAEQTEGIYNATGVQPVSNREFMKTLRKVMGKGWQPPAPTPFVRLGAYLIMRADPELALSGRNCVPKRLLREGFTFQYTKLDEALKQIIAP